MSDSTLAEVQARAGWIVGTWRVDPVHSYVGFVVRHMAVSKVRGRFTDFEGTIITALAPQESSVDATARAASIDTGNGIRDGHIRSAEFFDAEKHPELVLRSRGLRLVDDGWFLDADLAIRGVTKPVVLAMEAPEFGPGIEEGTH